MNEPYIKFNASCFSVEEGLYKTIMCVVDTKGLCPTLVMLNLVSLYHLAACMGNNWDYTEPSVGRCRGATIPVVLNRKLKSNTAYLMRNGVILAVVELSG